MSATVATVGLVYVAVAALFWFVQLRTRIFSTRYYFQTLSLFAVGAYGLYAAYQFTVTSNGLAVAIGILFFLVSLYHLGLFIYKFTIDSDNRYRWIHKANRALVNYDSDHQRFKLRTDDGVSIQAISLGNGKKRFGKAVIVCHGAGRSKNTMPIVQTCEILATRYDVFTFDFRGHMESGGIFETDGKTEFDLKAVIDHVERAGYKKIAVLGWSIGAWTALLSAAKGRHIDAVIAGSPPPVAISSLFLSRIVSDWRLLQIPILAGFAFIRNTWYSAAKETLSVQDFAVQIPNIPVLLIYNDYDYTLRVGADAFERLYERLPVTKERMVLPGKGHLFDWPNTYFIWEKVLAWLECNF